MPFFTASDGVELHYLADDFTDSWRNSDALVLLHSAMGSARRFYSWVPGLARHYRVFRLDLRGHGESQIPPPNLPLTIGRVVKDVIEFLDTMGLASAHLVGNSAGGYLAQQIAMDTPQRARSIALYGSQPGLKDSQAASWLPQVESKGLRGFLADTIDDRFPVGGVDPGLIEWFLDETAKNDTAYVVRFITLMASQDWSDRLHQIRCPTLLVVPGLGKIGSMRSFELMRERIPRIDVLSYEDAPHNVCDFLADRCVADLRSFLGRHFDTHRPAANAAAD
ncbi:MAG: alpha/beta hydrolase [Proteobacteria bacterium]|nr:alpha/beta hydrolase [Pseudomonadota bacterium]